MPKNKLNKMYRTYLKKIKSSKEQRRNIEQMERKTSFFTWEDSTEKKEANFSYAN